MLEHLWLPCMATVAAIALSAIVFIEFLKKRAGQSAVKGSADNDSATENGTAERAARSCPSPRVEETATSDYEVFLSFRGLDTRSGFTDYLYTSLTNAGIRTFKDDKDLHIGEEFAPELLQAINQSKISIPIFSKNYASSVWCLKEVVQMVERKKTRGHKIIPIFYDVAPSEVRYQTGIYEGAFRSYEKKRRYGEETINQWKAALTVVGEINGWDLHSEKNRREGEFVGKLTRKVFNELKQAYLVVSDCLVSVNNHVDAIMGNIGAQTSETRIIGIHGMGGIGKTTIAKIIYNQLSKNVEDCCFLSNIREMSKRKGIECLQNQLISDILKDKCTDIRNIDDGIKIIKDRLSNKRVLLILDDVHEKNHIDALVGGRDWFGRGSKLLITTRNKEVLDVLEVDNRYELTGMDDSQSLQLFSKHAFRRDSPLDEYIDQSNRVIDIAKGLPLALEVIGSLLSHTERRKWNYILEKLENVPHIEVQRKLKISYDALEVRHKHIFLDIACFFIGCDKDIMVHFWEKSRFFPKEALTVLQNMSLIKIEMDNSVWMHDQLKDLGREIVRQESNTKIKEQSRVWDPKEGLDLLRKHKGEKKVEALRLKLDNHQHYRFSYEDFENLPHLRFLEVYGSIENFCAEERLLWHESPSNIFPTNKNSYLLPQLRWLSWHNIPPTFNITNFSMEDVVILNLSGSGIADDWKGWSHMKVMMNLKVLDMSNCSLLERLPDFIGSLESLIELDISKTSIKELPDSIRNLKKLKVVKMRESSTRKIPDVLWSMGNLKHIMVSRDIYECRDRLFHVQIGNGICGSQFLRILILKDADIHALPRLPESLINLQMSILRMDTFPDLSNLTNLEKMDLEFGWPHHDKISIWLGKHPMPRWIGNLSKLEFLNLCSHHGTTSPTDLTLPPQLKSLCLECPNLRHLPRLPSSLSSLHLYNCRSLCSMEDIWNLKELLFLHISSTAIAEIQGLGCLENLRSLGLRSLGQVKILPDLSNLNKLTSLQVEHCDKLVEIQGQLPRSLDSFHVKHCVSLQKLPDLSSLMGKQAFVVDDCKNLNVERILDVAQLNPRHFKFVNFEQLQILPDLSNSNELKRLQVEGCHHLVEIQGELPQSLEVLEITSCISLRKLPNLSSLTGLSEVCIQRLLNLVEIPSELPQSLEKLVLFYCVSIQKLPYLSNLMRLREVCIGHCTNLVEIQGELPQSLKILKIFYCGSLQKLPYLSSSMGLREFAIEDCDNPVEIPGELPQCLKKLCLRSCKSLQKLPCFSSSMGLQNLFIQECSNLVEILGELPQSLEVLGIKSCKSLQKLPYLSSLTRLQEVRIGHCNDLVEIQGKLPQSLKILKIFYCGSLQKLPHLSSLIGLREFTIENCDNLVEILGELPQSLEVLEINSCKSLQKLPYLSSLTRLQVVRIGQCNDLVEIEGELPQSLEILKILYCGSLQKLPYPSSLIGLREFTIENCDNLVEILGELPQSLEVLGINSCKSLQKLPYLSSLMRLQVVRIGHCNDLVEIQGELPQSLEILKIFYCGSLQKLPYLSNLIGLQKFAIENCDNLVEIPSKLPQCLKKLCLHSPKSLQKLPCLSSSMGLRNPFDLIEICERSQSLEVLGIASCKSLRKLPNLSSSTRLRSARIGHCNDLVEIQGELPQSLEKLVISSCVSLQKLPYLSSLIGLRQFSIENCDNLVEISGELPQSLEVLDIYKCQSLQELPNLSSLKGLRKVKIIHCRKLNVEAISSLCSKMSVKFVEVDNECDFEDDAELDYAYDSE